MARNETVHLHNLEDLMKAFDNIKCPLWGLMCGTRLLHSYNEDNQVESRAVLEDMADLYAGNSAGRYTLVIYRNLKPGTVITNKSEYTNSIDFRLNDSQLSALGEVGYQERYGGRTSKDAINALEKLYKEKWELIKQLTEAQHKAVAPPPESIVDKISGIIDALGLADIMPHIALRIADKILPPKAGATALAGPTSPKAAAAPGTDAEREAVRKEMSDALAIMAEVVPDLSAVMMKFAMFSESNPPQFQLYINAIRQS